MSDSGSLNNTAIDESSVNGAFVWKIAFIAAMGGLLFGYDFAVIGGATVFYERTFGIVDNARMLGFSLASAPIGCIIGAASSMLFADRYGRKKLLIWSAVLFAVSALGTMLAWNFSAFNVFRILGGMGIGLAGSQAPLYIAETSPASYRGKVVTTNQLTIMIGIVVSQTINLFIQRYGEAQAVLENVLSWNESIGWRLMFGAEFIPAIAFFFLMFTVPCSPRWLVKRGRNEEARSILSIIGGDAYANSELADISSTISQEEVGRTNIRDLLNPKLFKLLLLGAFLAITQQWSGLNSVFAYSHQIFDDAGISVSGVMIALVFQGMTMLIFCVVAMFVVDLIGRKKLMLLGTAGIAIVHTLIGLTFYYEITGITSVVLALVAIALYAMTLAPVVWVLLAELFPNRIRGVAMGISVMSLWIGYLILIQTCPIMIERLGIPMTFWTYAAFLVVAFFVVLFALPETKGKSLEQIERELLS